MTASMFEETLHSAVGQRMVVDRPLFEADSGLQKVLVFENAVYGRVMAIDGVVQVTLKDEFIYHEMLTHVALLSHGAARDVLVIGGGDGGTIRRVLEHDTVSRVTLVELDRTVIDLARQYMPDVGGTAFDDPRLDLVIAEGGAFLANSRDQWDVIIVDGTDPVGPGLELYSDRFYGGCRKCLRPGGVLVSQCGVPFLQPDSLAGSSGRLARIFPAVRCFTAAIPSYYGGDMAFLWAGERFEQATPDLTDLRDRWTAAGLTTRFYSPERHLGSFALPGFIEALIAR
jgi:spermidine synthase